MIWRIFCLSCALAFAVAAVSQLLSTLRDRPLIAFASTLERADSLAPASEALLARLRSEIERRDGCEQSLARSRVSASLFLLDHTSADDPQERYRRLAFSEEQARRALACNPMDGNLWFVAGWLGFQLAPNAGLLHEHLLSAIRYAPYQGTALSRRWRVLAPSLAALGFAHDPRVIEDLERLYRLSTPRMAASVHEALRANGSGEIALAMLDALPSERKAAVERAILIVAAPSPARREFLRFGPRDSAAD